MRTPFGAWRATYTPGRWVALSGPTTLVILQPAPATASGLLAHLWDELLASASISQVSATLASFGFESMPTLAVFFWDDEQVYCLLRGEIQVVDADSGAPLASGAGARTWYETSLAARRIYVPLDDVNLDELLQLPLVVGGAEVSSVLLDATASDEPAPAMPGQPAPVAAPVAIAADHAVGEGEAAPAGLGGIAGIAAPVSPGQVVPPVLPVAGAFAAPPNAPARPEALGPRLDAWRVPGSEPEPVAAPGSALEPSEPIGQPEPPARRQPEPAETIEASGPSAAQADQVSPEPAEPVASQAPPAGDAGAPRPPAEPTQVLGDRPPWAPGQGPDLAGAEVPQAGRPDPAEFGNAFVAYSDRPNTTGPWGVNGFAPAAPNPPLADAAPPGSRVDSHLYDLGAKHDGRTVLTPAVTAPPEPVGGRRAEPNSVLAALCPLGHANPPGTRQCRVCGGYVDSHNPQLVNAPLLAVLQTSSGERLPLTGSVLIGRAPVRSGSDLDAELLRVPSPNHDISRTHVRVAPREWTIEVTDLHSTNGTVVVPPDGQPIGLDPGQTVELAVGGSIDLGDGQMIDLLPPA